MYSLIIQEYGQNTEGHICPNSTLSKYGRIQRISGTFQNTAEYRTKYSRIQTIGNCTKLDRKLYPSPHCGWPMHRDAPGVPMHRALLAPRPHADSRRYSCACTRHHQCSASQHHPCGWCDALGRPIIQISDRAIVLGRACVRACVCVRDVSSRRILRLKSNYLI